MLAAIPVTEETARLKMLALALPPAITAQAVAAVVGVTTQAVVVLAYLGQVQMVQAARPIQMAQRDQAVAAQHTAALKAQAVVVHKAAARYVLSGPAQLDHFHQQIRAMYNGTFY